MKKLFTPIAAALIALTAMASLSTQAEARRWRGGIGFGIASAVIGGAIIASSYRRHHGYYGGGYGYGYGYPAYGYGRYYSSAYDYDDDYYDYAPRRSYYYSSPAYYSYGYAPRRYYGGHRVIRSHRSYVRVGHHRRHGRGLRVRY